MLVALELRNLVRLRHALGDTVMEGDSVDLMSSSGKGRAMVLYKNSGPT